MSSPMAATADMHRRPEPGWLEASPWPRPHGRTQTSTSFAHDSAHGTRDSYQRPGHRQQAPRQRLPKHRNVDPACSSDITAAPMMQLVSSRPGVRQPIQTWMPPRDSMGRPPMWREVPSTGQQTPLHHPGMCGSPPPPFLTHEAWPHDGRASSGLPPALPTPPMTPGASRLSSPDLEPLGHDGRFCVCCPDEDRYLAGRAKMDSQLQAALAHMAHRNSRK
ncbi:hypothetical protein QBC33DRAFT_550798 [Phialemonium atrogriseum]|uniref:Uncharacterized protein n=1 Tax=Phialemonium atrogriseum TaxID=1093897 RepID=A0AAJ0FBZ5_9PEZI|nr:uncharacterized protein QBC33DRAFT_550798 [Phialemonium atrogriseum]KAK1763046.1 hypothetical protein QBC33DRAFT_550798 [Phialemonium atrogriseum]